MWNELAKRLASIVAEMEMAERSAKPNAIILQSLESLKGKPLDAKTFIKTIGMILKNSPKHAQGIRVVALRAGDGTGFSMKFALLASPKSADGPPAQWGFSEHVKVGKDHVRGQFGAMGTVEAWTRGNYPDLEKVLTQTIASDPDQPVEIRIYIAPEWRN